jgi:hypothetical protein
MARGVAVPRETPGWRYDRDDESTLFTSLLSRT